VPVNTAKFVATQLLAHGRVSRSYIGVMGQTVPIPRRLTRFWKLNQNTGILVAGMEDHSPAAHAGLEADALVITDQLARALMGAGESLAVWWGEHPEEPAERVALTLMNFAWNGLGGLVDGRSWTPSPAPD